MFLFLAFFIIMLALCIVYMVMADTSFDSVTGFFSVVWFVCSCFNILFILTSYDNESTFINELNGKQETITHLIEDGASDEERAKLVKIIMDANTSLESMKTDNKSWMWSLETPNSVDDLKPLRMIEEK